METVEQIVLFIKVAVVWFGVSSVRTLYAQTKAKPFDVAYTLALIQKAGV